MAEIQPSSSMSTKYHKHHSVLRILGLGMVGAIILGLFAIVHSIWIEYPLSPKALFLPCILGVVGGISIGVLLNKNRLHIRTIQQALTQKHKMENQFKRLMDFTPEPLVVIQGQQFVYTNRQVTQLLGYTIEDTPDMATWLQKAYPDPDYREMVTQIWIQLQEMIEKGEALPNSELNVTCANGTVRPMEFRLAAIDDRLLVLMRDLSQIKQNQERLLQTEKMVSVGGLAAGMAHEINNPLGGILQSLQLLRNRLLQKHQKNEVIANSLGLDFNLLESYLKDRDIPSIVERMEDAGTRAAEIVKDMLSFARSDKGIAHETNICTLIDKTLHLAGTDFALDTSFDFRNITIHRQYPTQRPVIVCKESQIQQVFLNILLNAAQAMKEAQTKSPSLSIEVTALHAHIQIRLTDNGPGMNEDIRRRIFEPFFTTKPVGTGTGLGLSISYFIITDEHNGSITVDSQPGQGTSFLIELPLTLKKF